MQDVFEAQKGAIKSGEKVIIVDDLIATGGRFGFKAIVVSIG